MIKRLFCSHFEWERTTEVPKYHGDTVYRCVRCGKKEAFNHPPSFTIWLEKYKG